MTIYQTIAELVVQGIKNEYEEVTPELVNIFSEIPKKDKELRMAISEELDDVSAWEMRCPFCGEKLKVKQVNELHSELDGSPVETFAEYVCDCGFSK